VDLTACLYRLDRSVFSCSLFGKELPADDELLIIATGQYLGEGFDCPQVDTLFMSETELESALDRPDLASNKFVLGAVAQNPNATAAILHRIAILQRADLHEPMGSVFDLLGRNRNGLAVMRLVARHLNTSAEDVERLASSKNEYVLGDVAGNPKVSEQTLWKLADRAAQGVYLIEWGLARNPKAPKDVLSRLAGSSNQYARSSVAANPQTPVPALISLSSDRISQVRVGVAINPSAPRSIQEKLVKDSDEIVRRSATARYHE
jgi:hypothetical protein